MRKSERPLVYCVRCKRISQHASRSLCSTCEKRSYVDGTIDNYERFNISTEEILADMRSSLGASKSYVEVAEDLGLSHKSAQQSYRRARKLGLAE